MCILCTLQIPLHAGVIMTGIQLCIWFVSAGVFICSWGRYGLYVEQYTRWGLCFLAGATIMCYIVMLGVLLGSAPQYNWPDIIISNIKDLVVTDYEYIAAQTRVLSRLPPLDTFLVSLPDLDPLPSHDGGAPLSPAAQILVQEVLDTVS